MNSITQKNINIMTPPLPSLSYRKENRNNSGFNGITENLRTNAFDLIANKEKIAQNLKCTKACRNVITLDKNGDFGVCYRRTVHSPTPERN